jgi:hypothetical protein
MQQIFKNVKMQFTLLYWILGGAALPALRSQILPITGFSR